MNNDVGSYDMMMYRYLLLMLFMVLHCVARGQTEYAYRYWMDNAFTVTFSDSSANKNWAVELDVSNLSEGVHTLHLQVRDNTGLWSNPRSNSFFKYTPVDTNNVKMRYWFDNGNEIKETQVLNGIHSLLLLSGKLFFASQKKLNSMFGVQLLFCFFVFTTKTFLKHGQKYTFYRTAGVYTGNKFA